MNNRLAAFAAGLLALAVACGGSSPTLVPEASDAKFQLPAEKPTATSIVPEGSSIVPDVDRSICSVPLEDILFDTFGTTRARFVPLNEISYELQTDLQDAIIPVDYPAYGGLGRVALVG